MTSTSCSMLIKSLVLSSLLFSIVGCGPAPRATIRQTSFAGGVTQEKAPENVVTKEETDKSKAVEDLSIENKLLQIDNKRDKLNFLQQRLTSKQEEKNSIETRITSIDAELAKIIIPSKNSLAAGIAAYNGDYARALALQAQATSAANAATAKKDNLTNLNDQMKAQLTKVTTEAEALKEQIDALAKEIEDDTTKVYSGGKAPEATK